MKLFIFFDLPTNTKKERSEATKFRNSLLKDGFVMMQYSIYYRTCKGQDSVENHINKISKLIPKSGNIRALQITQKQFERMKLLLGTAKKSEKIGSRQLLLF